MIAQTQPGTGRCARYGHEFIEDVRAMLAAGSTGQEVEK